MSLRPLPFRWVGDAMVPEERFAKLAKSQFVAGQTYVLEGHEPTSHAERGHYFASIKEAWQNLDQDATARYPTAEHLRKWALIRAGWRTENSTITPDETAALRLAAFVRKLDDFAVTVVEKLGEGPMHMVKMYTARSQKIGRPEDGYMTKEEWRQSRDDVLEILSGKIGVSRKALEREGRLNR